MKTLLCILIFFSHLSGSEVVHPELNIRWSFPYEGMPRYTLNITNEASRVEFFNPDLHLGATFTKSKIEENDDPTALLENARQLELEFMPKNAEIFFDNTINNEYHLYFINPNSEASIYIVTSIENRILYKATLIGVSDSKQLPQNLVNTFLNYREKHR